MKIMFVFDDKVKPGFFERSKIKKLVKKIINAVNNSKYVDVSCIEPNFSQASFVSVSFTDDDNIHVINKENREIDKATDVLSFPYLDFENGKYVGDPEGVEVNDSIITFGDIIISMDTAIRQADEYGHSKQREIAFLVCHSMLHLYGYDHMTDEEFKQMNDITEELLTENGYTRTGEK